MNANVSFASASDTREQKPQLRELAPGVYGYISDFDPNCGFVVGDEQVVLIDTRPTPRMARDFLAKSGLDNKHLVLITDGTDSSANYNDKRRTMRSLLSGSSLSRAASTQPAEPAPTIT